MLTAPRTQIHMIVQTPPQPQARALYGGLNGGEVWGNGAVGDTAIYNNFTYKGKPVSWRTSLDHLDTGFLEGAGG